MPGPGKGVGHVSACPPVPHDLWRPVVWMGCRYGGGPGEEGLCPEARGSCERCLIPVSDICAISLRSLPGRLGSGPEG